MHKRMLGRTGMEIAPIVFGGNVFGWTADEATSFDLLDRFVGAGFNAIDTADVYSRWIPGNSGGESETIIGDWLQRGGVSRDEVIIVTKVGSDMGDGRKGLKEDWIMQAVEDSLRRLKTDYIDVYLAHRPDPDTPYEETIAAFTKLREQGKVRAIGASNFSAEQLEETLRLAEQTGRARFDVLQPEYNLYARSGFEGALAELCVEHDIGVIPYYSLASGFLTGKYKSAEDTEGAARGGGVAKYFDDRGRRILAALEQVAGETGETPATIALAWLMTRRGVTAPIVSASKPEQMDAMLKAPEVALSAEALEILQEAGE
ncbi:aldo/keto reductase [Martelella endophytica]|uniref:Alcohol dehydrogenase n=1 Tax=Martelella endophytica TaxID=1486262 RepID=A0A0D5LPP0_MAREN|nr:aldo/keto reductase [Martelella endophytica]AJY45737.1 alcohol dehydrogenase [Martelella endophytica]